MYTRITHRRTHTQIYIQVYIRMHVPNLPSARPYLHPWPRASECRHVCATRAPIGGAAAHNRPRRTEARPSASAVVRAARPRVAHTKAKLDTDAVFHAPMLALNADATKNACAPKPHAVHADGQGSHGSGFRVYFTPNRQHEPANPCAHSRSIPIAHWCTHT